MYLGKGPERPLHGHGACTFFKSYARFKDGVPMLYLRGSIAVNLDHMCGIGLMLQYRIDTVV